MRNLSKVGLHQVVLFGVMGVLTLRTLLATGFYLQVGLLWWLIGMVAGFLFVYVDSFVFNLLMKPNESLSERLKEFFGAGRFKEGVALLLQERYEQKQLIMRSFLFLLVWMVLGFLTMSSVISDLPRGFVLGIGTHLVFDFIYDYFYDRQRFDRWFWQVKREFSHEEKRNILLIVSFVYLVLAMRF